MLTLTPTLTLVLARARARSEERQEGLRRPAASSERDRRTSMGPTYSLESRGDFYRVRVESDSPSSEFRTSDELRSSLSLYLQVLDDDRSHFSHDGATVQQRIGECSEPLQLFLNAWNDLGVLEPRQPRLGPEAAPGDGDTSSVTDRKIKEVLGVVTDYVRDHRDVVGVDVCELFDRLNAAYMNRLAGPVTPRIGFAGGITIVHGMVMLWIWSPGRQKSLWRTQHSRVPTRFLGSIQASDTQRSRLKKLIFQHADNRSIAAYTTAEAVASEASAALRRAVAANSDKLDVGNETIGKLWNAQTQALDDCYSALYDILVTAVQNGKVELMTMDPGKSAHMFLRASSDTPQHLRVLFPAPPRTFNGSPDFQGERVEFGTELCDLFEFHSLTRELVSSLRGTAEYSMDNLVDACLQERAEVATERALRGLDEDASDLYARDRAVADAVFGAIQADGVAIIGYLSGERRLENRADRALVLGRLQWVMSSRVYRRGMFQRRGRLSGFPTRVAKAVLGDDLRQLAHNLIDKLASVLSTWMGNANINSCGRGKGGPAILESLFRILSRFSHVFWAKEHRTSAPCPWCHQRLLNHGWWYKRALCLVHHLVNCPLVTMQRDEGADVCMFQSVFWSLIPGALERGIFSGGAWADDKITLDAFFAAPSTMTD